MSTIHRLFLLCSAEEEKGRTGARGLSPYSVKFLLPNNKLESGKRRSLRRPGRSAVRADINTAAGVIRLKIKADRTGCARVDAGAIGRALGTFKSSREPTVCNRTVSVLRQKMIVWCARPIYIAYLIRIKIPLSFIIPSAVIMCLNVTMFD